MPEEKKIEHIVLLMLENRSFDHLLGWLYKDDQPKHHIPPLKPNERAYEGLQGLDLSKFINKSGDKAQIPVEGVSGLTIPSISPGEEFEQVERQLFNGKSPITPETIAPMNGYLDDYVNVLEHLETSPENIDFFAPHIMQTYTTTQLPVLNGLAKHYAVCDHWYSSVPSQTNTNRAFSLTGTSQGLVNNGFLQKNPYAIALSKLLGFGVGDDHFTEETLFNALEESGESWHVFWETSLVPNKISHIIKLIQNIGIDEVRQEIEKLRTEAVNAWLGKDNIISTSINVLLDFASEVASFVAEHGAEYMLSLTDGKIDSCYTYRLFKGISERLPNAEQNFSKLDQFHEMARSGNLPKFSFIEPFWSISHESVDRGFEQFATALGNDYHAPSNLDVGEAYVQSIYESLIANKEAWEKTLLIITFDEPVGTYDHVPPPAAVSPWAPGEKPPKLQDDFEFNRLGGRVPAILVSPYIKQGTVFRSETDTPYDHTSIIKTVLKLVGQPEKMNDFGERTKSAPSFDQVLTETSPRTDERELSFLQHTRKAGESLNYYDRFYLQHEDGSYITKSELTNKITLVGLRAPLDVFNLDAGLTAYFPTLGQEDERVMFYLQKSEDRPKTGQINSGDIVKLITTDVNLPSHIVLGAWKDSHDCYYYNDYLHGENNTKQEWTIHTENNQGIVFGEDITLSNQFFNEYLAQDSRPLQGKWISTRKSKTKWKIVPVE